MHNIYTSRIIRILGVRINKIKHLSIIIKVGNVISVRLRGPTSPSFLYCMSVIINLDGPKSTCIRLCNKITPVHINHSIFWKLEAIFGSHSTLGIGDVLRLTSICDEWPHGQATDILARCAGAVHVHCANITAVCGKQYWCTAV